MKLVPGQEYTRRSEIHGFFGGQQQGGISTPSDKPIILIFTRHRGADYGYHDHWDSEGEYFYYYGEGQKGDQEFTKGNRRIRDHEENDNSILLFSYVGETPKVLFEGELQYIDHEIVRSIGVDGKPRDAIKFTLKKIGSQFEYDPDNAPISKKRRTERKEPLSSDTKIRRKPTTTERSGLVTSRVGQGYYRQEILAKFYDRCAVTGSTLKEVLIASHIVPWRDASEEERLDVENGILLSPNYDALFDKHLISFSDDGEIIFSKLLTDELISSMSIDTAARIRVTDGMKKYLAKHRERLR